MRLLALDTSTEHMSVAVSRIGDDGARRVWATSGAGGAHASSQLIPTIRALMAQSDLVFADLDAIVFGRGPGAFTGLRTACAVAQGLALGARADTPLAPVPVLPLDSLLAVAEQARMQHAPVQPSWQVLAMLDARMDELYVARYRWHAGQWHTLQAPMLARPQDIIVDANEAMAGNVFEVAGARLPPASAKQARITAWPTADAMLRLAPGLLERGQGVDAALALPLYIRDKVASTTAERAAIQSARTASGASGAGSGQ